MHKIYLENNIDERDFYDEIIVSLIDKLPADELIKGIVVKYDNKNKGIKLIWNIDKLEFSKITISYQIVNDSVFWGVQFSLGDLINEKFTDKKNDGLTFI